MTALCFGAIDDALATVVVDISCFGGDLLDCRLKLSSLPRDSQERAGEGSAICGGVLLSPETSPTISYSPSSLETSDNCG